MSKSSLKGNISQEYNHPCPYSIQRQTQIRTESIYAIKTEKNILNIYVLDKNICGLNILISL